MTDFRALVAREQHKIAFENLHAEDLPEGEVLVDVECSSLNYKDGLAVTGRGRIVRRFPMVLGLDLAGTVIESTTREFEPGDRVLGTGQGLGESDWGGFATRARVKANAILRIPDGLSTSEAMALGTAGITAMLSVMALEQNGIVPSEREIVVTGASGGVGSLAVHLLSRRGFPVAASTGRPELEEYLRDLGASSIVRREELENASGALQSERWGGAVDTVGGTTLANVFAQIAYGGAVACCGMAGGHELHSTVWPMILRNVSLLGVSSLKTPKSTRASGWNRLAGDIDHDKLTRMTRTEPLSNVFELSEEILAGRVRGRVVLDVRK